MATASYESSKPYEDSISGSGWVAFAGTMLILVGFFNVIDGIAAIANSDYLVNQLLFSSMHAWGWFFLVWGIVQIYRVRRVGVRAGPRSSASSRRLVTRSRNCLGRARTRFGQSPRSYSTC